jgi:hypothetical protein
MKINDGLPTFNLFVSCYLTLRSFILPVQLGSDAKTVQLALAFHRASLPTPRSFMRKSGKIHVKTIFCPNK